MKISGIKTNLHKTLSAALAVLVLSGVIGTIDSQTHVVAAEGTQVKQFSADFSELADIAAKSGKFSDSSSEYKSAATDDAVNAWINERFSLRYGRENGTSMERAFLGQSSQDINSGDSWGGNSYWAITADGWLKRKATATGDQMLRKWDSLVVKGSDGKPAALKNFETSFTVNQNFSERISGNKAGRGAVTLFFRQSAVDATVKSSNQAAVVIGKGGDAWDSETKTIGVSVLSGLEITDSSNDIYKNTITSIDNLDPVEQFRVTVRVVGTECTVTITSLDGATEYYSGSKTLSVENSGYISYGITNSTRSIGDITLTNLDDEGNPVDFEMASSLYYSITNMVPYSGGYTLSWGKTVWFPFYNEWADQANVFRYSVANVFDTYNSYGATEEHGALHYKVPGVAISVNNDCFGVAESNQWLGCYRTSSFSSDTRTLGRITSLVYKGTGAGVRYKNFSTEFSFRFNDSNGGLVLGLRQEDAGKFFDDNGSLNKKQGIVAITKSGITVASGNEINDEIIEGTQTNFESELPQVVKISVKLVESALNIRIASSDGTELFNKNYAVNYNRAGYLAFGVSASKHAFADISLTHLNSDGSTIGLNLSDLVTGDLNDDGKVNASDLITMKQALLSGTQLGMDIIDLTGDSTFDVVDLVRLKKLLAEYL